MLTVDDWAKITVIVALVTSLLKPLLEQYAPGFKTSSATHDNLLRVLNLVLCLAGVLYIAGTRSALTWVNLVNLLYYTANQFVSSQGLYFIQTRAGQSIGNSNLLNATLNAVGGAVGGLKQGQAIPISAPIDGVSATTTTTAIPDVSATK